MCLYTADALSSRLINDKFPAKYYPQPTIVGLYICFTKSVPGSDTFRRSNVGATFSHNSVGSWHGMNDRRPLTHWPKGGGTPPKPPPPPYNFPHRPPVADPGGGGRGDYPPPLNLSWYWKPMQRGGGGGGACECPRVGVFYNFLEGGWRHADNVQGVCACECPRVGVFYNFWEGGWRRADNVQRGGASPPPPLQEILYPRLTPL